MSYESPQGKKYFTSLPSREAWIEIIGGGIGWPKREKSLPSREAWIEITTSRGGNGPS